MYNYEEAPVVSSAKQLVTYLSEALSRLTGRSSDQVITGDFTDTHASPSSGLRLKLKMPFKTKLGDNNDPHFNDGIDLNKTQEISEDYLDAHLKHHGVGAAKTVITGNEAKVLESRVAIQSNMVLNDDFEEVSDTSEPPIASAPSRILSTRSKSKKTEIKTSSRRLTRPRLTEDSAESSASRSDESVSDDQNQPRRTSRSTRPPALKKARSEEAPSGAVPSASKYEDLYADVLLPLFEAVVAGDSMKIFSDPVSDDIAPGYSSIVTRPTDLATIRYYCDDLYVLKCG